MNIHGRQILGFIILIIGLVLTVLLINTMIYDIPLWLLGRKAPATIEETWWENFYWEDLKNDYFDLEYYFQYRFTTTDGEIIVGKSRVTEDEFLSYRPGSVIEIKYSPFNPSNNRLDDSRLVPFLLFSYAAVILICLFALAAGREMIDF